MAIRLLREEVEPQTDVAAACPFLRLVSDEPYVIYPHGVGCALRHGPAGPPSADELAWLCTNGCHHGCTTYRRWREMGDV
ncbi:MAG: hypothetical protein AAB418_01285 [candidate division NC10 bacterium]